MEEGIELSLNEAVNIPSIEASPNTNNRFSPRISPLARIILLNIASFATVIPLLNDASPFAIIFCANTTSLLSVFAGNAPPIILEEGIELSLNEAVKIPPIEVSPNTNNRFSPRISPPAITSLLKDASLVTIKLLRFEVLSIVIFPFTDKSSVTIVA